MGKFLEFYYIIFILYCIYIIILYFIIFQNQDQLFVLDKNSDLHGTRNLKNRKSYTFLSIFG